MSMEATLRLKIGTIHAFQGSEADVIIWDLVDTRDQRIGKLYHGDAGSRLVNVAISRAQGKLVVVGDVDAFHKAPAHEYVEKLSGILWNAFNPTSGVGISAEDLEADLQKATAIAESKKR